MKTPTLIGSYDRYGYSIEQDGQVLYSAGNHRQDSSVHVDQGSAAALSLRQLRACCKRTLDEMCEETGARNGGVERI